MRLYRVMDFLRNDQITISSQAQTAPHYPFTLPEARKFFRHFETATFEVESDSPVRSIYIFTGKHVQSGRSFANGYLLSVPLEVYERRGLAGIPDPIGTIDFEYDGIATSPRIRVTLAPKRGLDTAASAHKPAQSGTRIPTTQETQGRKSRSFLMTLAALAVIIAAVVVVRSYQSRDKSGLAVLPPATASRSAEESIRIEWPHDLSFAWWQPVFHEDRPIWLERGDIIRVEGDGKMLHKYQPQTADGGSVSFDWKGTRYVHQTKKYIVAQLINKKDRSRVLGLQACSSRIVPQAFRDHAACDLSGSEEIAVKKDGFLFLCPNLPVDGNWGASGVCNLTIEIVAADGDLAPPENVREPRMAVVVGKDGNIRSVPSVSGRILTTAKSGSRLPCVRREGDWYRVQVEREGTPMHAWIHRSLISDYFVE